MNSPTYFIFCLRSANAILRAVRAGIKTIEEVSRVTRLPADEVKDWNSYLGLGLAERLGDVF